MIKKLSARERQLLVLFLLLLFGVVFVEFFLIPSVQSIISLKAERNELQQQWVEVEYVQNHEEELRNEIGKLERNAQNLQQRIPEAAYSSLVLQCLLETAANTDIHITMLQEEAHEAAENVQQLFLQLNGAYENINAFIEELSEMPYDYALTNVQLHIHDPANTTANLTFYISLPLSM